MRKEHVLVGAIAGLLLAAPAMAVVQTYGDIDLVGFGYPTGATPESGATLEGLAPGVVTVAANAFGHSYPFAPDVNDFPGTDEIHVGSNQTAFHDGYSGYSGRVHGPLTVVLDYSSLVPAGQDVQTLTLGLGADDFQYTAFGQPFSATVNGQANAAITNELNGLNQTGPYTQFFTAGIDPADLTSDKKLTLTIDEGGDGGDGYALDYLTVGVTTSSQAPAPEPAALTMLGLAGAGLALRTARRGR